MLEAQQDREERRQQADRQAYDRLRRAYAASKAADAPGGAAAALKAAMAELHLKPLDILRIFEAERVNLQEQAAMAAADARAAEAQVARAQASTRGGVGAVLGLNVCVPEAAFSISAGLGEIPCVCTGQACTVTHKAQCAPEQEALHEAGLPCEQFDEIEGQARTAARQTAAAEQRAAQLAEEAAALRLELGARPTQAQLDSLQRQVDIMERQLAKAAADKAAAEAKEAKRWVGTTSQVAACLYKCMRS